MVRLTTGIAVDVGGTFTDLVFSDGTGAVRAAKVPTTPDAPERGVLDGVRQLVPTDVLAGAAYFVHGTTVGLNALLQRRGATVGLLATDGFRDVLEIRRGDREEMYNIFWRQPEPLVPRRRRLPVRERITAEGAVDVQLHDDDVRRAVEAFQADGVTAVAIAFLNAYANPAHEVRAEQLLREHGFTGEVSVSHRVSGEYREYERTSTTVVDAFVKTRMAGYLEQLETGLRDAGFGGTLLCTRSGGGALTFAEAADRPFETIMSGPVGAATGAGRLSGEHDLGDLITADVGGTSFDTCVVESGEPHVLHQGSVQGMPILSTWVDVRSIGAGGGSVAEPVHGLLKVGPRSAGAQPGPACYGRGGTEPTVTDAATVLGLLGIEPLASGVMPDVAAAEAAVGDLAGGLGLDVRSAAEGVLTVTAANMADAIREITIERGIDPTGMSLLAIGGAGPLLGVLVADQLDITRIVVPVEAGNFSAWGLLGADLTRSAARTHVMPVTAASVETADAVIGELLTELRGRSGADTGNEDTCAEASLDLRYVGQEHTLSVSVRLDGERIVDTPDEITKAFEESYRQTFGVVLEEPTEVVTVRAAIRTELPRLSGGTVAAVAEDERPKPRLTSEAYSFDAGAPCRFDVYDRSALRPGHTMSGPLLVLEDTTTTYVDRGHEAAVDASGCLVLTKAGAHA